MLANLYQTKGRVFLALGDWLTGVKYFTVADSLYETSSYPEMKSQSSYMKSILGKMFMQQHQMEKAKEYFDMGLKVAETQPEISAKSSALLELAIWYCMMKQYKEAKTIYFKLVQPPYFNPASYRMIYIFAGLGDVYMGLNRPDSALYYYGLSKLEALAKGEHYQLDQSYGRIATAYLKQHNISKAKSYFDSTLYYAGISKNISPSINAYQSLADIAITENDYKKAYSYLQIKQKLGDSLLSMKNLEMSNNLYILNNVKQKDAAIATLADLDISNRKLIQQGKTISYLLYAIVTILSLSFIISIKRIRQKRKIEKQLAIQLERERITADLHDDVGATLSSMHIYGDLVNTFWETQPQQSKDMVGKISMQSKELMERMSDIVWSLKPPGEEKNSFTGRLINYTHDLLTGKNIAAVFAIDEVLTAKIINPLARKNLLLIAKEAINNIAKYSQATEATIAFNQQGQDAVLTISDNGKGFDKSLVSNGNGLGNIAQRSKQLNGNCIVETSEGNGVTFTCSFPIAIISHAG